MSILEDTLLGSIILFDVQIACLFPRTPLYCGFCIHSVGTWIGWEVSFMELDFQEAVSFYLIGRN